jgi:hypothetical protein
VLAKRPCQLQFPLSKQELEQPEKEGIISRVDHSVWGTSTVEKPKALFPRRVARRVSSVMFEFAQMPASIQSLESKTLVSPIGK